LGWRLEESASKNLACSASRRQLEFLSDTGRSRFTTKDKQDLVDEVNILGTVSLVFRGLREQLLPVCTTLIMRRIVFRLLVKSVLTYTR
jgi:hypothetical protein